MGGEWKCWVRDRGWGVRGELCGVRSAVWLVG